ncbi:MAG: hypothetical protein IJY91_06815 [Oscillospiraceae bacterium]|nr:hypothetical protein [Oscillospiraceae bacterium]
MKTIQITVTGNQAVVTQTAVPVSGTVGLPVEFIFDDAWEGLSKTAVFRANGRTIDRIDVKDSAAVPWELLKNPGCRLWAGVYGTNFDGSLQIPTIWADLGIIQPGADPSGDESADPTLPVWEQARRGSVSYSEKQELSEIEKNIARMNIGAMEYGESKTNFKMNNLRIIQLADGKEKTDAATVGQLQTAIGDIETALDSIIAIQESLIGGGI